MNLDGKVTIVTGAGRGVGCAIAKRFASHGAKVCLAARTACEIQKVADDIVHAGGTAIPVVTDITNEADVSTMVRITEERLGPIDILVNNAGAFLLRSITETSLSDWNKILGTNLLGAFLCARAVLPSMMQRKNGRIINIASMAGRRGYPHQGAYCASKHGLYGLSKVLAIEGQPYGIRVSVVSPGGVLTNLSKELLATRDPSEATEWMTPDEVAETVLFIAQQDGSAATDEIVLRRYASEPWR